MDEKLRNVGIVKWFDTQKGFGFLSNCLNGSDIFVHFTEISVPEGDFKILYAGEYVSYSDGESNGKAVAKNVTGVCGGKLLVQSDTMNKKRKLTKKNYKKEVSELPDPN